MKRGRTGRTDSNSSHHRTKYPRRAANATQKPTAGSSVPRVSSFGSDSSSDDARRDSSSDDDAESESSAEEHSLPISKSQAERCFTGYAATFTPTPSSLPKPTLSVAKGSILCSEHSHVKTTDGTFPFTRFSQCIALEKLQIEYTRMGFLCRPCKGFIRPKEFLDHLKPRKNHPHLPTIPKADRAVLSNHILSAYSVSTDAVFPIPEEVTQPIDGLSVDPAHQCPEPECNYWATTRKASLAQKLRCHFSVGSESPTRWHGIPTPSTHLTFQYIMRPYRHVSKIDPDYQRVIKLPQDWTPTQPMVQHSLTLRNIRETCDPDRISAPSVPFLQELGWPEFIHLLQCPLQTLLWIAESPLRRQYQLIDPQDRQFYIHLYSVCQLVPGYLLDGNRYAFSLSSDVRNCLTFNTKAKLRQLEEVTYFHYARPIQRTLSLLLWISHIMMTRDSKAASTMLGSLGGLLKKLPKDQKIALSSLWDLMKTPDQTKSIEFLPALHNLLISIVRHDIVHEHKLACATDYSLCIGSLLLNGHFRQANYLTCDCAALQHAFLIILFHESRLQFLKASKFTPHNRCHWLQLNLDRPLKTLWESDEEIIDEEEECDDIVEEMEADAQESEDVEESADAFSEPKTKTPVTLLDLINNDEDDSSQREQNRLLKYLQDNAIWVQPRSPERSTPYTRMKVVWMIAAPVARLESSASRFACSRQGDSILIRVADGSFVEIPFIKLQSAALAAITACQEAILSALPMDCHSHYANFNCTNISDNLMDCRSLFQQDPNSAVFQLICSITQQALLQSGSSSGASPFINPSTSSHDSEAIYNWLILDHRIQELLCAALVQTIGVPPRDFQMAYLQYDHNSTTNTARNLFLLDGVLALGNPKAKQMDKTIHECIWQVAPSLSKIFLFYFGVLRPIVPKLIDILFPSSPHLYQHHHHYVFVNNFLVSKSFRNRHTANLWNGTKVNRVLQQSTPTFPVRLTCRFLRNLITAILWIYFPQLNPSVIRPEETATDQQGQHTANTSNVHYGRSGNILATLRMPITAARNIMQVSRAYQVILGLVQFDENTRRLYANPQMLVSDQNKDGALSVARAAVCQYYQLGGKNTPEDNENMVDSLLTDALYYGKRVSKGIPTKIGDAVLEQVVRTLIFGLAGPTPLSLPLPGGCTVGEASLAVQQIEKAIKEWETGQYQPIGNEDITIINYFDQVKADASNIFEIWHKEMPEKWTDFTSRVYSTAIPSNVKGTHSWVIRNPFD